MRKLMLLVATVATAAVFCGCASVTVTPAEELNGEKISRSGAPIAHLQADNWGIYLFMIPLLTGDTENPGKIAVFQDTVTVKDTVKMLTAKSKELKAKGTYTMVTRHSTNPWFFGIKEIQISANAAK